MSSDRNTSSKQSTDHLKPLVYDCTLWRKGCLESSHVVSVPHHVHAIHAYIRDRIEAKFGNAVELRYAVPRRDWHEVE